MKTPQVSTKLKEWLREQWRRSNHSKYQHYFEEWLSNITEGQINGFELQMYRLENHVLGK